MPISSKKSTGQKELNRTGKNAPRRKQSPREKQEFGPGKSGIIVCPACQSTYFEKSWHPKLDKYRDHLIAGGTVKFQLCPADQMKKERTYEGEVIITIAKPSISMRQDILNAVNNADVLARQRDPLDRVLWTEQGDNIIKVYTSENQLAVRIGKKLKDAFRGSEMTVSHSHGEDLIRVHWNN